MSFPALRRVVVTGLGVVSPIGADVATFWQALCAGKSGVSALDLFPIDKLRTDCAAIVRGGEETWHRDVAEVLDEKERELHGRVTKMLVAAGQQAVRQARLADLPASERDRVGVILGTGQGSVEILGAGFDKAREKGLRTVSPFFIPSAMPNAASALLSIKHGLRGPTWTMASACATGIHALAVGALLVATGEADAMIVGGGEAALQPACLAGFGNARALAKSFEGDPTRASRPFDADRTGFVIGEGAGALVVETEEHARARKVAIIAHLIGWGSSSDASHLVRPPDDGRGLALAIERAMQRAGLTSKSLGYINPHATSTQAGDIAEYHGLRAALGDHVEQIPISASKSILGHLLGGAGAVEAVATALSVQTGTIHPSLNVDRLDPVFTLDVARTQRRMEKRVALKTSAGFGGHDAAIVLSG